MPVMAMIGGELAHRLIRGAGRLLLQADRRVLERGGLRQQAAVVADLDHRRSDGARVRHAARAPVRGPAHRPAAPDGGHGRQHGDLAGVGLQLRRASGAGLGEAVGARVVQLQVQLAVAAGVEDAQPVGLALHLHVGVRGAVDEHRVEERVRHHRRAGRARVLLGLGRHDSVERIVHGAVLRAGRSPSSTTAGSPTAPWLAQFAADHADDIDAIDLNPVIVHAQGVSVVDALILRRDNRRTDAGVRPSSDQPRKSEGNREDVVMWPFKDIGVEKIGHVALVEIRRPPHNYFDVALIRELATAFEALDAEPGCRALVLAAQGKAFCAGANFGDDDRDGSALLGGPTLGAAHLYIEGPGCSGPRSRSSLPFTAPPSAAGWAWRWWPIFG